MIGPEQPAPMDGAGTAKLLWRAVLAGDEFAAGDVVVRALGAGVDPESILLDAIGGVQRRVGAEWAANRLTVAQEHAATAINDKVITTFGYVLGGRKADRGRITVACVDGEWHSMPARLLAEVLKLRGFDVDYLGAQVPAPHLIAHLHRSAPDAVALSSSIATRLPVAHATITACQAAATPVIAGGAAFGQDGRYARLFGTDAWAPNARAAADRLADPMPRPMVGHQPIDDLPHLADQEYTLVSRNSSQLVKAVLTGLEAGNPLLRARTEPQRHEIAETLVQLVEYLATSLYVGDAELFTGFVRWTATIHAARGAAPGFLMPALDVLATEMRDFTRSTAVIDAARELVAAEATGVAG
jgi:methanogenic corrinoid protein MtbC1